MFVKERMTVNPTTIADNASILEAGELLRKNDFTRLPVMHDGKLVGIITQDDLLKVSPSQATTLSVWELNYVLSKLVVKEVMTKNPISINSEATLEEAALLMREKEVGALPVVDNGKLVGIITESDIFDAFLDLMGLKYTGTRLTIDLENRIGAVADLTELIKKEGLNIISMALFTRDKTSGELVMRLDSPKSDALVEKLKAKGYRILHVANWS
ncbi:MAG: CBS and ACT domain-containing protein [Bacillota bacterium]